MWLSRFHENEFDAFLQKVKRFFLKFFLNTCIDESVLKKILVRLKEKVSLNLWNKCGYMPHEVGCYNTYCILCKPFPSKEYFSANSSFRNGILHILVNWVPMFDFVVIFVATYAYFVKNCGFLLYFRFLWESKPTIWSQKSLFCHKNHLGRF